VKNPIPADEWRYYKPVNRVKSMLELGNKKNPAGVYKCYFESRGVRHVSIDWNGEDGALNLDLRLPIWDKVGKFDMVTNIGTTEHVERQAGVWENIHMCCKVGGVVVSITPRPGDWWWHGEWYPTELFFKVFAELNSYRIDAFGIERSHPTRNNCCRMTKLSRRAFTMPDPGYFYHNAVRAR